jgi:HAD superfamily hydrolase (TIGR01458 family)
MIKGVLLDLSGTVYIDDQLLPGALEAISSLQTQHIPLRFITNTSRRSRQTLLHKLRELGLAIDPAEVFTAPQAVRNYLVEHRLTPWLLVHPAIEEEFSDLCGSVPNVVVLGDAAEAFTYANLNTAFRLLLEGARLLVVGDNRYFREGDGLSLDAGPFVTALEYASGCQAIILGKPATGCGQSLS